MRCVLAVTLLLAIAAAEPEPDASVAEPGRWVGPSGSASGSFRSRALPVVTEVEEAWQLTFDRIETPPVHWDGTGYVVARIADKPHLVAFDLATGKERARVLLRGFLKGSPLLVWDHLVMLQPDEEQITGYRLNGKRLDVAWMFRGSAGARPRAPVVHDNEIYCFLGYALARIRPGASVPSWMAAGGDGGAIAVYGDHVYVASFGPDFEADHQYYADLSLSVFRRSNGTQVNSQKVCQARRSGKDPALQLMVAAKTVYVGSEWPLLASDGFATHAIVDIARGDDFVGIGTRPGLWTCRVPPAHHPKEGTLLLSPPRGGAPNDAGLEWCADRGGGIYKLAAEDEQPECFRDRVSPTVLGAVVYFGSWAADIETGEILWRLPVKHVTCAAVPADGLVLVVDDGRTLRAFRGRGKR